MTERFESTMCRNARFVSHADIHQAMSRLYKTRSLLDLGRCESNGRTLHVMCECYSNLIEVAHLKSTISRCVIRERSEAFARFGMADILVTYRVGWGIAPMVGHSAHPLNLANIEFGGSAWRSNDSLHPMRDLSTPEIF